MTPTTQASEFAKQCEELSHHLSSLMERAAESAEGLNAEETLHNLSSVVEELSVAGEELSAQADEIYTTREELIGQRQRFQELFEATPDAYLVTDETGLISECNTAGAEILNIEKPHTKGKSFVVFVAAKDKRLFLSKLHMLKNRSTPGRDSFEMVMQPRQRPAFVALVSVLRTGDTTRKSRELHWLIHDITEQRALREQRETLLRRLVNAHEEERARIARELHDEMAQQVTALIIGLQSLKDAEGLPAASVLQLNKLKKIAENIVHDIRDITASLHPPVLDQLGLPAALSNLVRDWSESYGIPVSIHCAEIGRDGFLLDADARIAIYRIVQQALNNIAAHAKATHASVVLKKSGSDLHVIVEDDGIGFDPRKALNRKGAKQPLGILSMRERAAALGGTLQIESKPAKGSTIFVRVPLPEESAAGIGAPNP